MSAYSGDENRDHDEAHGQVMSDTCPRCGAGYYDSDEEDQSAQWQCKTYSVRGEIFQSAGCRIAELQAALDATKDAFRELACYGQAGGYNQDQFDLPTFVEKIRFLIDEGVKKTLALDAANKRIAELTEGAEVVGGDMMKRLHPDSAAMCNSIRYWIVSKEYNTRHAAEKALKGTP